MTEFLEAVGPRLGMSALRACCPQMPRSVLTYLLVDYRQQFQAQRTQVVETLPWKHPGAVWAIDHSEYLAARQVFDQISRNTFQCAIVQYQHQYNDNACTAGDALTDTLLAVHRRRAIRQALVELGYLDITRRSVPQPLHVAKCARIT